MTGLVQLAFMRRAARCGRACPDRRGRAADGGAAPPRARAGGTRGRRRRQRRGCAVARAGARVRRRRPRRDASGHRRVRDVPAAARGRGLGARADADGARYRRGSRGRSRHRRGRLPAEAVRVRGAARTPPGARPPRRARAAGGARGRFAPARPRRTAGLARRGGARPLEQGVHDPRDVHAAAGRGAQPAAPARARVGLRVREPLERHRRLHPAAAADDRRAVRRAVARDRPARGLPAPRGRRRMRRIPIRLRVAAAFAVAMAIVLAGTGFFLYSRLESDLRGSLDGDLRLRAQDLAALVRQPGSSLATAGGRLVEQGESYAQLLDPRGSVLQATPGLGHRSLLSGGELARAGAGTIYSDRRRVPGLDEPSRLLATPVSRGRARLVLVVGATQQNGAETLSSLREELLIAGPLALVLASAAGYLLAGLALRPVEAMRRRAAAITAETAGERLPVAPTGDEVERLGETLNAMLGRLDAGLQRERQFVADAGHELRTPLALLRTELELALRHADSAEELREAVRRSSDEADRLGRLAEDLLLIARTDQGQLQLRREPLGAAELLESVAT